MRSRPGTTTSAGGAAPRADRPPGDAPRPATGLVFAVPPAQAVARRRERQRHAVIEPVLERDEAASLRARWVKPGKAREFALGEQRIEQKEQLWTSSTGTSPATVRRAGKQSPKEPEETRLRLPLGMEIPRRRQQREARAPAAPGARPAPTANSPPMQ